MAITVTIQGGPVQLTGIPIWIKVSGGSAPVGSSDYKLLLKVIDVNSALFFPPVPEGIGPDAAGEAFFNISGKVDQPVTVDFQYPADGPSKAYPTKLVTVKVQCGEWYVDANGDPQEVWGAESATFQLLKGGVSQRQIAIWNKAGTNFYTTYIAAKRWLTHRPWGDFVHPTQPVMLWFIPLENKTVTYRVRTVYTDDSEEIYTTSVALSITSFYQFNCNPADLGVNLEPAGKKAKYFDVVLRDGETNYSDSRRFTVYWKFCERPVFMLFQNSIGGVDDAFFSGRSTDDFNVDAVQVRKNPAIDAAPQDPTIVTPHSEGQNQWTLSTGHKSITQMLHLRDLLVSRQKWLLYPNVALTVYMTIPVIVANTKKTLVDYTRDIHEMDVEIKEAETSQFSFDNRLAT